MFAPDDVTDGEDEDDEESGNEDEDVEPRRVEPVEAPAEIVRRVRRRGNC